MIMMIMTSLQHLDNDDDGNDNDTDYDDDDDDDKVEKKYDYLFRSYMII